MLYLFDYDNVTKSLHNKTGRRQQIPACPADVVSQAGVNKK
jgi:hypothetical protein